MLRYPNYGAHMLLLLGLFDCDMHINLTRIMSFWKQEAAEYKKTLSLSIPVIIAQAGQITVSLIDNVMYD